MNANSADLALSERFTGVAAYPFALVATAVPAALARWAAQKMGPPRYTLAAGLGALVGIVMGMMTFGFFAPITAQPGDAGGGYLMAGYIGGGALSGLVWLIIEHAAFPGLDRTGR